MKTQLEKIISQLEKMSERAEDLAQSDNSDTADKYDDIASHLEEAIGDCFV